MSLLEAVQAAKRVYIIGNGGSHANAQHICNDLLSCGIRAHTIDSATLSAFANDHNWVVAYSIWLKVVGEPGDLLIAMSGSGTSLNINNAVLTALSLGMDVHTIYGNERGENMQEAEEAQLTIGHQLRSCLQQPT